MRLSRAARIRRTVYSSGDSGSAQGKGSSASQSVYWSSRYLSACFITRPFYFLKIFFYLLQFQRHSFRKRNTEKHFSNDIHYKKEKSFFSKEYFILSKCVWARIKKYVSLIFVWRITYCSLKSKRDSWVPFFVSYRFF